MIKQFAIYAAVILFAIFVHRSCEEDDANAVAMRDLQARYPMCVVTARNKIMCPEACKLQPDGYSFKCP